MNVMQRAHEIRTEAATRFNCDSAEIVFSICLEMAWEESRQPETREELAERVAEIAAEALAEARGRNAEDFECDVWAKYGKLRVYLPNSWGYLVIKANGKVSIDNIKAQAYQDVHEALKANNINWCWE